MLRTEVRSIAGIWFYILGLVLATGAEFRGAVLGIAGLGTNGLGAGAAGSAQGAPAIGSRKARSRARIWLPTN